MVIVLKTLVYVSRQKALLMVQISLHNLKTWALSVL